MKLTRILPLAALAAAAIPFAAAQDHGGQDKGKDAGKQEPGKDKAAKDKGPAADASQDQKLIRMQRPSYPLTTCPLTGEDLGDKPAEVVADGTLVRLCCEKCIAKLKADPKPALKKIGEAVIAAQKPGYPLRTSVVSDAKLDDKAVDLVHGTRLVRLANRDEVARFEKDPKGAMEKLNKAYVAAQVASYPLKKCVVSDEEFGGEMGDPVDYLYGTKLVRFCCKSCVKEFEKSPEKYVKALAAK